MTFQPPETVAVRAAGHIPVTAPTPDLVLATPQERKIDGNMIVKFPAGRYVAAYRTEHGTVYRSQGDIFAGSFRGTDAGILILKDGGQTFQLNENQRVVWRLDRPLEFTP